MQTATSVSPRTARQRQSLPANSREAATQTCDSETAVTAEKQLSLEAAGHGAGETVVGSGCSSKLFRNVNRIYWEENKANKSYWGLEQKAKRAEGGEPTGGQKRGTATGIGSLGFTGQVVRDTRTPSLETLRGLLFG